MDTRSEIYPVGGLKSSVFLAFGLFYTVLAALEREIQPKTLVTASIQPPHLAPSRLRAELLE